jgi:hypothetical protein
MSVQVNNTDNQLSIITNGVLDVYAVKTIKSVSRGVDVSGNSYIIINFIANDKNNSLRINLSEVTSPVTWTNDAAGAATAVSDIRDWLGEIIEVEINEANDSILIYGFDGVANQPVSVTPTGEVNIRPLDCDDKVSLCFNDGVSDVTVSSTNPLPVNAVVTVTVPTPLPVSQDPTSNPWVVGQATHDNLNANANIQVDNTDVSAGNPVPVLQQYPDTPYASAIVATGTSTTPIIFSAGTTSISVQNLGNDNIRIDTDASSGIILPPGVSITWDAPVGQRFDTFTFTGLSVSSLFIVTAVIAS